MLKTAIMVAVPAFLPLASVNQASAPRLTKCQMDVILSDGHTLRAKGVRIERLEPPVVFFDLGVAKAPYKPVGIQIRDVDGTVIERARVNLEERLTGDPCYIRMEWRR